MDLVSDYPFWPTRNGLIRSYPYLAGEERCDVAIVGGGITGAILVERLSREGLSAVLVERRDVCMGSTSASTALLQYEIDVPLVEMTRDIGKDAAERAYRLSVGAVDSLRELAESVELDCAFETKTSVFLATDAKKRALLEEEAIARQAIGIDVRLVDGPRLKKEFGLDGVAALVSSRAASCDPYRLAHGLLHRAHQRGARIYDRTEVVTFDFRSNHVRLWTNRGRSVTADRLVMATGYEAQTMLDEKVVDLKSTYAAVSEPLEELAPWDADWIMWEAKDPYLYLRATGDNRLLVGGEDDDFRDPDERDSRVAGKARTIKQKVEKYLPDLDWEIEFQWAGTFGETDDGLAYIGVSPEYPLTYFALGFGGNGITFSAIAADVIAAELRGEPHPDAELFRFGR